jgi:hypothetical protein
VLAARASRTAPPAARRRRRREAPLKTQSILSLTLAPCAHPQESRLLAVVVAKNAVGSSWRKTVGSREWSRVPDEEKAFARAAALRVVLADPSERVALQAALLVTNAARFDVPRPWEALLPELAGAAAAEAPTPPAAKRRALVALKHVLRALRGKRFVLKAPAGVAALTSADMAAAARAIDDDRALMFRLAKGLLGPLRAQWAANFSALLARGEAWEARGALAAAGLAALRELLHLLPDLRDVEADFDALLAEGAAAAAALAAPLFGGPAAAAVRVGDDGAGGDAHVRLMSKSWERLLQTALVAMDRHTLAFACHLSAWATLAVDTGLLGIDAAAVHHIRAKSRVLFTRFLARALLQPLYKTRGDDAGIPLLAMGYGGGGGGYGGGGGRVAAAESLPLLRAAAATLDEMLVGERCAALVRALVAKYLTLSPEELAEWEADPESLARRVDAETSPDADTPRPCGVALMECMLERAEEATADALVALAAELQAVALTPATALPREATYRAIGEVFPHLRGRVDFGGWYASELRGLLAAGEAELAALEGRVLVARALWLVGVCGEELAPLAWGEAFGLAVRHVAAQDAVVALMAVSAATSLIGAALEEQQYVRQPREAQRLWHDGPGGGGGGAAAAAEAAIDEAAAEARAAYEAHAAAVEGSLDALLGGLFALLPRLAEVESMVRVLQCVSAAVELMGARVRPHLGAVAAALPRVWAAVQGRHEGEGTGALARLLSSLIAMLAHLVAKLGTAAAAEPAVTVVALPLVRHATDLAAPGAETLVEEGLRLWLALLHAAPALTPELAELLPARLAPLLARGRDNAACFRVAEGYALLAGAGALAPALPRLAPAMHASLAAALAALRPAAGPRPGTVLMGALAPEAAAEAAGAAALLSLLQRLAGAAPPPAELGPAAQAAAALVHADYGAGTLRLPARAVVLVEACLEVVYRAAFREPAAAAALAGPDLEAQGRLVDRWVALASSRDVGELFVPAMAAAGRARRHAAAVALCSLVYADALPALREEARAAQALVLGLRAAREQPVFERDAAALATAPRPPPDGDAPDQLLARRLALSAADPLRAVDAVDAARAAAARVEGWIGRERVAAALEAVDPMYGEQYAALAAGRLGEAEEAAAIAGMAHASVS